MKSNRVWSKKTVKHAVLIGSASINMIGGTNPARLIVVESPAITEIVFHIVSTNGMRIGFSIEQNCHSARVEDHITMVTLQIAYCYSGHEAFTV